MSEYIGKQIKIINTKGFELNNFDNIEKYIL